MLFAIAAQLAADVVGAENAPPVELRNGDFFDVDRNWQAQIARWRAGFIAAGNIEAQLGGTELADRQFALQQRAGLPVKVQSIEADLDARAFPAQMFDLQWPGEASAGLLNDQPTAARLAGDLRQTVQTAFALA